MIQLVVTLLLTKAMPVVELEIYHPEPLQACIAQPLRFGPLPSEWKLTCQGVDGNEYIIRTVAIHSV